MKEIKIIKKYSTNLTLKKILDEYIKNNKL